MRQRGTSLVELLIVVAIIASIAMVLCALPQGARPFAMRSSTAQFDAALAYAQSLAASSGNGATMVFTQRLSPQGLPIAGFVLTIYSGRPTAPGALAQAPMEPLLSTGDISEARIGAAPFTIFLNGAGHAGAMTGAVAPGSIIATDPGCPPGESRITLTFSDARTSDRRVIPCNAAVAGPPVALGTVAPDPAAVP